MLSQLQAQLREKGTGFTVFFSLLLFTPVISILHGIYLILSYGALSPLVIVLPPLFFLLYGIYQKSLYYLSLGSLFPIVVGLTPGVAGARWSKWLYTMTMHRPIPIGGHLERRVGVLHDMTGLLVSTIYLLCLGLLCRYVLSRTAETPVQFFGPAVATTTYLATILLNFYVLSLKTNAYAYLIGILPWRRGIVIGIYFLIWLIAFNWPFCYKNEQRHSSKDSAYLYLIPATVFLLGLALPLLGLNLGFIM